MNAHNDFVFLFECRKTLLDNDCVQDDLGVHLEYESGPAADLTVGRVGDLIDCNLPALLGEARAAGRQQEQP